MAQLTAKLIKSLVAPFWERRDGLRFRSHLRFLSRSQYWEPERLETYQRERLNLLLRHAFSHCPFYRERLRAAGYSVEQEWKTTDLLRLPVLEKEEVRQYTEQILADNFDPTNLRRKRTGGSTAVPLHLYVDRLASSRKTAATWRHNRWVGYDIGDRLAMIWGATPPPDSLRGKMRQAFYERTFALDTLAMTDNNMQDFLAQCRRKKPHLMLGHAHSVYLLADFCLSEGIDDVHLEAVITTAMVLTAPERTTIEKVFHTKVFNRYGCEELSIIASECEVHHGMHLHAEGLIAEVLQGDQPVGPEHPGDLILTDLENYAMPFLRYRIGDVAALAADRCSCGRTLPLLTEVRGRTADFLYTPEGNRVFGISVLDTMMIHIPGIRQAQIIQNTLDELTIRLAVHAESFAAGGEQRLRSELPRFFGSRMNYHFEFVEKIPPDKNGKYRFAICRLSDEDKGRSGKTGAEQNCGKGDRQ